MLTNIKMKQLIDKPNYSTLYKAHYCIFFVLVILCIGVISAWSNTTFNNSLGTEDITFSGSESYTRYLQIPSTVNLFTDAYLNLSGIYSAKLTNDDFEDATINTNLWTYSIINGEDTESISEVSASDGYLHSIITGNDNGVSSTSIISLNLTKNFHNRGVQIINFTWNYTVEASNGDLYGRVRVNVFDDSTTRTLFTIGGVSANGILTKSDWSLVLNNTADTVTLYNSTGGTAGTASMTGTNWVINFETYMTEGAGGGTGGSAKAELNLFNFTYGFSLPSNVSLNISTSGSNVFNYSGTFDQLNNKTIDFATTLKKYLNSTYLVGSNYIIPFVFHSDSIGILRYANMFFGNEAMEVNSETYNSTTIESSTEAFILNITYDSSAYSLASAILNYNGTNYVGTKTTSGTDTIFSRSLLVPTFTTQQLVPFYWNVSLTSGAGTIYISTDSINQTVAVINASIYGKPYTVPFINFTVRDEETGSIINATFSSSINYGSSSLTKNLAYSDTTGKNSTFSFSFNPYDKSYLIGGTISLSSPGYESRLYTIPEQTVTNTTTLVNLYLLNESDATSYIIYVRDSSYSPAENANVYVQRYYPGTNEWITVNILTTNADGKVTTYLVENDVNYRFLIYVSGSLVLTSTPTKVFCEAAPCTITLTIPGDSPFVQYGDLGDLDYTFVYSTVTETFTYSYSDSDSTAQGGRLKVIRSNSGNATVTTICDETSTDLTKILTCDISSYPNGTYYGYAYNIRDGETTLIKLLTIQKIRNIVANIGLDGLVWTVFFIIGIVMIGLINPAVAIVFTMAGLIFMRLLGLASITYLSLTAVIAVGIILLWGMKRQ